MGKRFFFTMMIIFIVFALIIAFENIFVTQSVGILFFAYDNVSLFFVITLSAALGFLTGFCFMMYSHELRLEHDEEEREESIAASPAKTIEEKKLKTVSTKGEADDFDQDDEILG